MPRAAGQRATGTFKTRAAVRDASPAEVAAVNARKAPSERVGEYEMCGARLGGKHPTGKTCIRKAGEGTDHPGYGQCKTHGGITAAGKKSAARLMGRELIKQTKFGGDLKITNVTAEEALLEEVRRSVAMVRWLEDRIGQFAWSDVEGTDLGGLPKVMTETTRGYATFSNEREWLILYRDERTHSAKVAKMALDAGIAERLVKIAEDQGVMLAQAIKAVLDALGLNPRQSAMVPTIVPQILRQVASGTIIESETA